MASSFITRGSSSLDSIAMGSRPKVKIELKGQTGGSVSSYTTGDCIQGTATVTVDRDTRFDDIEISLEGTSRTSVERASLPGRTGAYQTFLRLRQPIEDSAYPTPRILEPGRPYLFSFMFVVPDRLLPHVCTHSKTNLHVERSHTLLPPTLGDAMQIGNGKALVDDMSPEMCSISYLIRVSIHRRPENKPTKTLASVGKKVRIVPAVDEEPPLNIPDNESVYCTRREKDVKRGVMRGKLGRLVVAASQPKPVQLSPPNAAASDSISSAATVHLRFDPVGNEEPPRLGTVWSKLRVSTFYSAEPWGDYPSSNCAMLWAQMGRGIYSESVPLSTMCVASAQWTKHTMPSNNPFGRCDSIQSNSSTESLTGPSASFAGPTYYTASVVVPISLPKSKTFSPTFHSCLISRTYALDLSISYHTPNANILTPTASLKLPIQLTCQSRDDAKSPGSAVQQIITPEQVDAEFFSPRSVAPPQSELQIAPPEYSDVNIRGPMMPPAPAQAHSRDLMAR